MTVCRPNPVGLSPWSSGRLESAMISASIKRRWRKVIPSSSVMWVKYPLSLIRLSPFAVVRTPTMLKGPFFPEKSIAFVFHIRATASFRAISISLVGFMVIWRRQSSLKFMEFLIMRNNIVFVAFLPKITAPRGKKTRIMHFFALF